MTDHGWGGLRSASGFDLSFDAARHDEWDFTPQPPKPAPVPHEVMVGLDDLGGPFTVRTWVACCSTCRWESVPVSDKCAAQVAADAHAGGREGVAK